MKILLLSLLFLIGTPPISIYTLQFTNIDGEILSFNNFVGKKILITNIATSSSKVDQLSELVQLKNQFNDSIIIIALPSNSFGNEQKNNEEIKDFCDSVYHTNFYLAEKQAVTGIEVSNVISWLTSKSKNGVLNSKIGGDFQKFIIDSNGELVGVFPGKVSPLSTEIVQLLGNSN